MSSQGFNGGVVIRQGRRKRQSQPLLQVPGEAHGIHRGQTVVGEWLADIYVLGLNLQNAGELGDQPVLNGSGRRKCFLEIRFPVGKVRTWIRIWPVVCRLLRHGSLLYHIQASCEKAGTANMALNLPLEVLGMLPGLSGNTAYTRSS